jgi:transcription antitermination factor NusG
MSDLWYALQVKSRYENIVEKHLCARGFSPFLPRYKCRRRWSDRFKEITLPLFPGYLFCQLDVSNRRPIITTPGVTSIVGTGNVPVPIDEAEITAIQAAVGSGLRSEPWQFLRIGQRVIVNSGPLCGLEGILLEFGRRSHLVLSITLLQRSIAVHVDSDSVMPLPEKRQFERLATRSASPNCRADLTYFPAARRAAPAGTE